MVWLVLRGLGQGQEGARALNIGVQAALQVARRAALQPNFHHCFHVPRRTAPPLHLNFTEMSKVNQYNQTGWKKHEFAQIRFHFLSCTTATVCRMRQLCLFARVLSIASRA